MGVRWPFAMLACGVLAAPAQADAADDGTGRDFPKTLIFDEPGIDDEISLPTLIVMPQGAPRGTRTDVDFELDKRLTAWLSLQLNAGYTSLPHAGGAAEGWQNTDATLKFMLLTDPPAERLLSLSLTREFGGTGALRVGAPRGGATTVAFNAGQGWSPFAPAPLKPFAVTASAGVLVPDRPGAGAPQAVLSASLQYSFDVLAAGRAGMPAIMRPLIPIVECVFVQPASGPPARMLAPGLIYAGQGFQLAAEALLPLTASAGAHPGFIAQLNISLVRFGTPMLTRIF